MVTVPSIMNPAMHHRHSHELAGRQFHDSDMALNNFNHLFPREDTTSSAVPAATSSAIDPYTHGLDGVSLERDYVSTKGIWGWLGALACAVMIGRIVMIWNRRSRRLAAMDKSPEEQRYWAIDQHSWWTQAKKYLIYAPLGSKRHNREMQLSKAIGMGCVPTRFHTIILFIYFGINIAFIANIDYSGSIYDRTAEIRGRTGNLAVVNMIPLFILSGRNNPMIKWLQVSFDTYNMLHRWIGRTVIIEAVAHTIAWAINNSEAYGFAGMNKELVSQPFLYWGAIGTIAFSLIMLQSLSPIRHAFYETFLHLHQLLAFFAFAGTWIHIDLHKLPQYAYIRATVTLWVLERFARFFWLIYNNYTRHRGMTQVVVEALPGEACRVTFYLPRAIRVQPGTHVYAYLPYIAGWMSHPFSVAWTEPMEASTPDIEALLPNMPRTAADMEADEKGPGMPQTELAASEKPKVPAPNRALPPTTISLIISARQGMTRKLYNLASTSEHNILHTRGFLEGPYGSHASLESYGTVALFAAGAGITHHLIQVRHLLASAHAGMAATRRIYLIWSIRELESLSWVQPWMDQILSMPGRRSILRIKLFVSKPRTQEDVLSQSTTVQFNAGRCSPQKVLADVMPERIGAMMVSVCGPGAFADEVRDAVRGVIGGRDSGSVDFEEEAFTW